MKKLFTLFLLLFVSVSFFAQTVETLLVSEVTGSVQFQLGKERKVVVPQQKLNERDILIMGESSMLILLNPGQNKRYTVKGPYTGALHNYIQRNGQSCVKDITSQYMKYLVTQLFKKQKKGKGSSEDGTTFTLREGEGMIDSITLSVKTIDSLYHAIDSLSVVKSDTVKSKAEKTKEDKFAKTQSR